MQSYVGIAPEAISKVKIGDSIKVRIDALGKDYTAKIAELNPIADNTTKNFKVKLTLDNPDKEIKDGMFGNVIIPVGQWYNSKRGIYAAGGIFMPRERKENTEQKAQSGFFLVQEQILPEAIKKTIRVKEMLKRGDARTINEAVDSMGLSRSAYYKYKDYVFPFYEASRNKIISLTLLLEHKKGVLSSVLNTISADSGSVLTINQGIPLQGVANATVSIETANLSVDLEALLDKLRMVDGVKRLEVLGQA